MHLEWQAKISWGRSFLDLVNLFSFNMREYYFFLIADSFAGNTMAVWLCVLAMSRTCFRVSPHSILAWMSRTLYWKQARNLKFKWLQLDSNPERLRTVYELSGSGFESSYSHHGSFLGELPVIQRSICSLQVKNSIQEEDSSMTTHEPRFCLEHPGQHEP